MYRKHLKAMELRERAFAAREKSARARQLSARAGAKPFEQGDERAASLEEESREIESRLPPPAAPPREPRG
jgi:hypothetical protein